MIIKRCDRCGEELKSDGNVFDTMSRVINKTIKIMTGKLDLKLTNGISGEDLDLCKRCRTSLEHWMRYGEAIKKTRDRIELKKEEHPEEKTEEPHSVEEVHVTDDVPCEKEKWHIPKFGEF